MPAAFARARQARVSAIFTASAFTLTHAERLNELALAHRMVLNYSLRLPGRTDAFIVYSADPAEFWYRCAGYVDRIFKGAAPGTLAVEQPTRFQLVLNAKNLAAIGIKLPPALLARADQVIQ